MLDSISTELVPLLVVVNLLTGDEETVCVLAAYITCAIMSSTARLKDEIALLKIRIGSFGFNPTSITGND